MDALEKLKILTDAAKYDAACTSSGSDRGARPGKMGSAVSCGICHSFATDGRCISLLKVLMTNACVYDCRYCVNRRSADVPRVSFAPRELAELTAGFYRRNYIEGLFLSSAVIRSPDYTCERMVETLRILREDFHFAGYIHAKAIPGADGALIERLGFLADRLSVNIELPSEKSLSLLAPDKTRRSILTPMAYISGRARENSREIVRYRHAPKFAPAGQSTQMIIGATPETDYQILRLTENLYQKYGLKRVFFSAYIPVTENALLPSPDTRPPLLREHRLYQADWLLRYYGFGAEELLDPQNPGLNPYLDPKCGWALSHMEFFPVEVNSAPLRDLLRVPGIGVTGARRVLAARRACRLDFGSLKKLGVVLRRARYFVTCGGKIMEGLDRSGSAVLRSLMSASAAERYRRDLPARTGQLSFFDSPEEIRCLR